MSKKKKSIDQLYAEVKELKSEILLKNSIIDKLSSELYSKTMEVRSEKANKDKVDLAKCMASVEEFDRLIGCAMIDCDAAKIAAEAVGGNPTQRTILNAIKSLVKANSRVDLISVADALEKAGKLNSIGGAYWLASLSSKVTRSDCKRIIDKNKKKQDTADAVDDSMPDYDKLMSVFERLKSLIREQLPNVGKINIELSVS